MADRQMWTGTAGETRVQGAAVEQLSSDLRGDLLGPDDDGYDEARTVWNATADRHPALIARCAESADVVRAVRFARDHDLLVAVRGGGHSVAGTGVCDGGLTIDLSPMREVTVDTDAQVARVGGGATFAELDGATQELRLAVPGGVVSTTGVGGLTLGGGVGRLSRRYGLTADNLLAAEVVTADGATVDASPEREPDLFWGLRGGGGNFGVVTEFRFTLHEVGPQVLFGPLVYPLEEAGAALRSYRDFAADAPRECSVWADFLTAPPLPFLPEGAAGTRVLFIVPFWVGDLAAGAEVLRPLREHGAPLADAVAAVPYVTAQQALDPLYAAGARNYWRSQNLAALSDAGIDVLVSFADRLPTPQSDILIMQVGGAVNDTPPDATAYPHRDAQFIVTPGARWEDGGPGDGYVQWAQECSAALESQGTGGSYVNFITEGAGRERTAFGRNYERLVDVKNRYDPDNVFRLNQNVQPEPR